MPCKAGYPKTPCPFGYEGTVTRDACGACVNFIPPRHILAWCALYDATKTVCTLPRSACNGCPHKMERPPGRPPGEGGVDWKDPKAVAAYQKEWRTKNADKLRKQQERFNKKHPDYHATYRATNREKLRQAAREYYRLKKGKHGKASK